MCYVRDTNFVQYNANCTTAILKWANQFRIQWRRKWDAITTVFTFVISSKVNFQYFIRFLIRQLRIYSYVNCAAMCKTLKITVIWFKNLNLLHGPECICNFNRSVKRNNKATCFILRKFPSEWRTLHWLIKLSWDREFFISCRAMNKRRAGGGIEEIYVNPTRQETRETSNQIFP